MKKKILSFTIASFVIIFFVLLSCYQDKNNSNINYTFFNNVEFSANLYYHKLNKQELKSKNKQKNVYLYVVSLNEPTNKINLNSLEIKPVTFNKNFYKIIEVDSTDYKDIFLKYVTPNPNSLYKFYVVETNDSVKSSLIQSLEIKQNDESIKKNIDIYMVI